MPPMANFHVANWHMRQNRTARRLLAPRRWHNVTKTRVSEWRPNATTLMLLITPRRSHGHTEA